MTKKRSAVKKKTSYRKNFINTVPFKFQRGFDYMYLDRDSYIKINRFLSLDCSAKAFGKNAIVDVVNEVVDVMSMIEGEEAMHFEVPMTMLDAIKEQMPEKYYEIKLKKNKTNIISDVGAEQPEYVAGEVPEYSYHLEKSMRFVGAVLVIDLPDGNCMKEMYFFVGDTTEDGERHLDMNKQALFDICDDMRRKAYQFGGRATITNLTDVTTNLYTLSTALSDFRVREIMKAERSATPTANAAESGNNKEVKNIMKSILEDERGYSSPDEIDTDNSIV